MIERAFFSCADRARYIYLIQWARLGVEARGGLVVLGVRLMELYHGSYVRVPEPKIVHSAHFLDFGMGFYTTTDKEQAIKFTDKFTDLGKDRIVNMYEYDKTGAEEALSILRYPSADTEWLRYVAANRMGRGKDGDFDIVAGPVANDRVFNVVRFFEVGVYSEEDAIKRFLTFRLTDQIAFKTEKSLGYLKYTGSEKIAE